MLPREEARAGWAAATGVFLAMVVFGLAAAVICAGAETGVFAFLANFLTDFLAVFFAAGFFAAFFVFPVFPTIFFAAALAFFARFFVATVLAERCDTFLALFFFEGFFLATTNSLINGSAGIDGIDPETERLPRRVRKHPEHRENQR